MVGNLPRHVHVVPINFCLFCYRKKKVCNFEAKELYANPAADAVDVCEKDRKSVERKEINRINSTASFPSAQGFVSVKGLPL